MPIVVVGGSSRGAGKTALVCALIAALPEFRWTAVKISTHGHGLPKPIWEETQSGQGTDTARYLAAGAHRALLVTAEPEELGPITSELLNAQRPQPNLIFESNSVVDYLEPDLCLAVMSGPQAGIKPSFESLLRRANALLLPANQTILPAGLDPVKPVFHWVTLGQLPPEMLAWLRLQLHARLHP